MSRAWFGRWESWAVIRGNGCYLARFNRVGLSMCSVGLGGVAAMLLFVGGTDQLLARFVIGGACAVIAVGGAGWTRRRVEVLPAGVVVQGGWRPEAPIPWDQFDRFVAVRKGLKSEGRMLLRDGTDRACGVLHPPGIVSGRREVERLVAELNRIAARVRPAETAG